MSKSLSKHCNVLRRPPHGGEFLLSETFREGLNKHLSKSTDTANSACDSCTKMMWSCWVTEYKEGMPGSLKMNALKHLREWSSVVGSERILTVPAIFSMVWHGRKLLQCKNTFLLLGVPWHYKFAARSILGFHSRWL